MTRPRTLTTAAYRAASSLHRRARRGTVTLSPQQADRLARLLAALARAAERTPATPKRAR